MAFRTEKVFRNAPSSHASLCPFLYLNVFFLLFRFSSRSDIPAFVIPPLGNDSDNPEQLVAVRRILLAITTNFRFRAVR